MRRKAMAVCLLGAVLLAGCGSGGSAKGVKTFTEPGTVNGEVTSAKRNESAVLIKAGGAALINNAELSRKYAGKAGKADTAVVLLEAGKAVIKNSNLTSDAAGSAGILIGDTAEVEIADTALSTAGEQSPGIETRGSGALYAWDNMIGTTGNDSAALSVGKDGSMTLSGGTFTATGEHAPAVSASGKGWINAATLTAGNAEALTLEDGAQLSLYDCHVSGNMPEPGGNQKNAAVILRRAENSEANATAPQLLLSGGTLRAQRGNLFYVDAADASIVVKNVTLAVDVSQGNLLLASNGAKSSLSAYGEMMEGHLVSEEDASAAVYLRDVTKFTGDIQLTPGPGKAEAPGIALYIDGTSIWVVNGNSTLRALYAEGLVKDDKGLDVTIQGQDGTVYRKGKSAYTVTVTGEYKTSADFRGAGTADEFSAHAAERPESLR
nr:hypothetical protein [uncultured Stomatobaculum sp.]